MIPSCWIRFDVNKKKKFVRDSVGFDFIVKCNRIGGGGLTVARRGIQATLRLEPRSRFYIWQAARIFGSVAIRFDSMGSISLSNATE